ncbi:terminase small subunit, Nu1 [Octadecabacter sp. G9-8]|uniref:Terminase small subunit, Nu1 n=1 Tax=Octadecabacter dasysiphoniae TaxID=2909341 RepID=A0ABS9CV79_9RHOB|nr:terminase small subunit, Nu1 [Octadecabacter dasysiphoniae]MCF2870315.1 terminase small subunit, Nu1 [Octadecabacter dasysiphoniae]
MNDIDDFLGFDAETVDEPSHRESPTDPADDLVTSGEVADWIGLTTSRVSQLARDGVLPRSDMPGPHGRTGYPLKAVVRAYTEYLRSRSVKTSDPELAAAKLRLTQAQADKTEALAARNRGDLLEAQAVAKAWIAVTTDLRAALLAVPERVAGQLGLDRDTTAAIDAEVRTALEVIAND